MKNQSTYPLRLPRSVKAEVERRARQDGISVNQFVAAAVCRETRSHGHRGVLRRAAGARRFWRLRPAHARKTGEAPGPDECRYLEDLPLLHGEKVADGDPELFTPRPTTPLGGVRALGFSHVIAGPGLGRGLAYHGADVLNLWMPNDFEMDFNYYSANVGMRSAIMDFRRPDEMARFRRLVAGADNFFANRRPGLLEELGITNSELARLRPGIDFSIYGAVGPWANRIGFD
jgi:hypothetical protein